MFSIANRRKKNYNGFASRSSKFSSFWTLTDKICKIFVHFVIVFFFFSLPFLIIFNLIKTTLFFNTNINNVVSANIYYEIITKHLKWNIFWWQRPLNRSVNMARYMPFVLRWISSTIFFINFCHPHLAITIPFQSHSFWHIIFYFSFNDNFLFYILFS